MGCFLNDLVQFRRCLGRFATGVTVITCSDAAGEIYGITANSFSSVSLEPPLVLWNIAKCSRSLQAFLDAKHFGINVLTADQEPLSRHFASSEARQFEGISYSPGPNGVPRLDGALAWFECEQFETHDCGDHHIIIGEVKNYEWDDGEPLLFYRGQYGSLAD